MSNSKMSFRNAQGNLPIGMALVAVVLAFVVFGALLIGLGKTKQEPIVSPTPLSSPSPTPAAVIDISKWQSYYSPTYGFEVKYPSDWEVFEGDLYGTPAINIYKTKTGQDEDKALPLSHHSSGTHVSIFPKGVPTEGVLGENHSSKFSFDEETKNAIDFTLAGGMPWASYLNFKNPPSSWEPFGFVWLSLEIINLKEECISPTNEIVSPSINCFDVSGAQFVRSGKVSAEDRLIEERILSTFHFVRN